VSVICPAILTLPLVKCSVHVCISYDVCVAVLRTMKKSGGG
jgi:hypothetical protein